MRFRDFDVAFEHGSVPDPRELSLRTRAFVEAVVTELRARRIDAPWIKLAVLVAAPGARPTFMPPQPKVGISVAVATVAAPDSPLTTAVGPAIRPMLAELVAGTRDLVREAGGWDDPRFWDLVDEVGSHAGPFTAWLPAKTDRRTKVAYHLTWEFDEDGTRLRLDARQPDGALSGRTMVGDFPGAWELLPGRAPRVIRLTADGVDLLDHAGDIVVAVARPDRVGGAAPR